MSRSKITLTIATGRFDALVAFAGVQIASLRQSSEAKGADTPAA